MSGRQAGRQASCRVDRSGSMPPTPLAPRDPASATAIDPIEASRRMSRSAAQRTGQIGSVCSVNAPRPELPVGVCPRTNPPRPSAVVSCPASRYMRRPTGKRHTERTESRAAATSLDWNKYDVPPLGTSGVASPWHSALQRLGLIRVQRDLRRTDRPPLSSDASCCLAHRVHSSRRSARWSPTTPCAQRASRRQRRGFKAPACRLVQLMREQIT